MNILPSRGYCLVSPVEPDEEVDGVFLPDRAKETQPKGVVLAVGKPGFLVSGGEYIPEFKVGDTVYHKKFTDNKIKDGAKELLLIPFQDILAKIDG